MKKMTVAAALFAALTASVSVQAADLSHTQSWGNSVASTKLDTTVTGNVVGNTIKYATDRSDFNKPTAGCGSACSGTSDVDNDVVSASLSVSVKNTALNEKTTGSSVTTDSFCDTSISGGILTATQGKRESATVTDSVTAKDNVTTIKGYDVKVDTSTNGQYPGLGQGNDVTVQVNGKNSFSTNAAQGFTVDTSDLSVAKVSVSGFDGTSGTENGIGLSYTSTDLKVVDKSITTERGNSYSVSSYSSLK